MNIVFHDVDGCLNADANSPIPISGERFPQNQLAKLKELGRKLDASTIDHLVINTGRSMADTLPLVENIASNKLQYAIAEHGAVYHDVLCDKEIVPQGSIVGRLQLIRDFIDWYRQTGALILKQHIGAEVPILDKVANLTLDARNGLDSEQIYNVLQAIVRSESPFNGEQLVFHHSKADKFVDVLSKVDKGDGIDVVTELLSRENSTAKTINSIAIGNGLNDMPMLEVATIALCPANAEPEVLDYCRSRSSSGLVSEFEFIDATLQWLEGYV